MGLLGDIVCGVIKASLNDNSEAAQLYRASHPEACRSAQKFHDDIRRKQKIERRIAKSQNSSNNEGCFITTAVCDSFHKPDDCYELTAFRKFRDGWLKLQSDGQALIEEYYRIAPPIVAKINALPNAKAIYREIWDEYLSKCLRYIQEKDYSSCKKLYVAMVENLKAKFNAQ